MQFITIPESIQKLDIAESAKKVYAVLWYKTVDPASHKTSHRIIKPVAVDQTWIAQQIGLSRKTVNCSIKELSQAGLITVTRRYKQTSIYTVKDLAEPSYLLITPDIARGPLRGTSAMLYAFIRFSQGKNERMWWSKTAMASRLGRSVRTIKRCLRKLIDRNYIAASKLKKLIFYQTTGKFEEEFNCNILSRLQSKHRTKGYKNIDKTNILNKITPAKQETKTVSHKEDISFENQCQHEQSVEVEHFIRTVLGVDGATARIIAYSQDSKYAKLYQDILQKMKKPSDKQGRNWLKARCYEVRRAYNKQNAPEIESALSRMKQYGVRKSVAENLVYVDRHPPESIHNAIDNAIAVNAFKKIEGKHFNLAGYIVKSLSQARKEGHIVKPLKAIDELQRRVKSVRNPKLLDATAFEMKRLAMLAQADILLADEQQSKNLRAGNSVSS